MTLLEAFRTIGPSIPGDPEQNRVRQAAASVLLRAVRAIRIRGFHPDQNDEAYAIVIYRLVRSGPRGELASGPSSEPEVLAYLHNAVRNACRDVTRNAPGQLPEDFEEPGPEDDDVNGGIEEEVDEARRMLFGPIAQAVARTVAVSGRSVADRFLETVRTIEAIDLGQWEVPKAVQARNKFYTRKLRALRELRRAVQVLRERGAIDERRHAALQVVFAEIVGRRTR